ncbi:hypothetical protein [Paenibacillus shenyangensis]|uniref:hypothetical protein n=1 Tax=Paenibacillus sp. A9 TaxID=1284352 RepID=UPI000368A1E9|nr:hypothetical protein [Paenibacillus sp. A9]
MKKFVQIACISSLAAAVCLTGAGYDSGTAAAANSYFHAPVTVNKQTSTDRLKLTAGPVTVNAYTGAAKDYRGNPYINKLHITDGKIQYDIALQESTASLDSISVSPSGKFIAIKTRLEGGSQLLLVNLKQQKHIIINHIAGHMKNVESMYTYSWSPTGDQLAFAYGDSSMGRIAIYNASSGKIIDVPRETSIISTTAVLWNSQGTVLDHISEYPSNHFGLYRYTINTKKVKMIKSLTIKQMQELSF